MALAPPLGGYKLTQGWHGSAATRCRRRLGARPRKPRRLPRTTV